MTSLQDSVNQLLRRQAYSDGSINCFSQEKLRSKRRPDDPKRNTSAEVEASVLRSASSHYENVVTFAREGVSKYFDHSVKLNIM